MVISKLSRSNQTTLPRQVREALGVEPGDKLIYEIHGDSVVIRIHPGVMALFGALKPAKSLGKVEFDQVRKQTREKWAADAARKGLK